MFIRPNKFDVEFKSFFSFEIDCSLLAEIKFLDKVVSSLALSLFFPSYDLLNYIFFILVHIGHHFVMIIRPLLN